MHCMRLPQFRLRNFRLVLTGRCSADLCIQRVREPRGKVCGPEMPLLLPYRANTGGVMSQVVERRFCPGEGVSFSQFPRSIARDGQRVFCVLPQIQAERSHS